LLTMAEIFSVLGHFPIFFNFLDMSTVLVRQLRKFETEPPRKAYESQEPPRQKTRIDPQSLIDPYQRPWRKQASEQRLSKQIRAARESCSRLTAGGAADPGAASKQKLHLRECSGRAARGSGGEVWLSSAGSRVVRARACHGEWPQSQPICSAGMAQGNSSVQTHKQRAGLNGFHPPNASTHPGPSPPSPALQASAAHAASPTGVFGLAGGALLGAQQTPDMAAPVLIGLGGRWCGHRHTELLLAGS